MATKPASPLLTKAQATAELIKAVEVCVKRGSIDFCTSSEIYRAFRRLQTVQGGKPVYNGPIEHNDSCDDRR